MPARQWADGNSDDESIFGIHIDFFRTVKGGFFLRKKPLECVLSVYINSEEVML
jgi:hypothetical protein